MKIKIHDPDNYNLGAFDFTGHRVQLIQCNVTFELQEELEKDIRAEECLIKGNNIKVVGGCNYVSDKRTDISDIPTEDLINELKRRCD